MKHKITELFFLDRPFGVINLVLAACTLALGIAEWPNRLASMDFILVGWFMAHALFYIRRRKSVLTPAQKAQIERDVEMIFIEVASRHGYRDGHIELPPPSLRN